MKQELDPARDRDARAERWSEAPAARRLYRGPINRRRDAADEGNACHVAGDIYLDVHRNVAASTRADGRRGVLRLPLLENGRWLEGNRGDRGARSQILRARQDGCADERAGTG